jgi:hypothetical protein
MIGEDALHATTQALLAYGRALIGASAPPPYAGAAGASERLFVLERVGEARAEIRASGPHLDALFGKPAQGLDLAGLFSGPERALFLAFLTAATAAPGPGVIRALDAADQTLELLIAPLAPKYAGRNRYLGHIQPLAPDAIPGRMARLRIGAIHTSLPRHRRDLRLVVSNPER